MILNYEECMSLYGTHYKLNKAIKASKIFKIKKGIYSTDPNPKDIEIFLKSHPNVVFTMQSAFYYLCISDVVPDKYVFASNKDAYKYKEKDITQYFINNNIFDIGIIRIVHNGIIIPIYSKERMLIEVARYKNKLPYDYYKEIITYYRNHIDEIDASLIVEYMESFPKKRFITRIIKEEVF